MLLPCLCSADMPDGGKAVTSETQSSPEPEGPGKTGEEGEISAAATIPATQGVLIVHGTTVAHSSISIIRWCLDGSHEILHLSYVRLKAPLYYRFLD